MHRSAGAAILALAMAAPSFGQQIKVAQGSNPAAESKWVALTLAAQASYPKANGSGPFTPSLSVRCEAKGKPGKEDLSVAVLFDTGGVQPGSPSTRSSGAVALTQPTDNPARLGRETLLFPMKLDGKQQRRTWELLPSSDSIYAYEGAGVTILGTILSPYQFLEKVFGAKTLAIEFQPFGQGESFTAQFLTGGLKKEFQQHKECSLK